VTRVKLASCLASSIALLALLASAAAASTDVVLSWPQSKQPIRDGEHVQVGETLQLIPGAIPCQAFAPGQLISNSEPTDVVSGITNARWNECGSTQVSRAFARIALHGKGIVGIAQPAITISEPGGCAYGLRRVSGSGALQRSRASFSVSGEATLAKAARSGCVSRRRLQGTIGLFGPQAGGFGLLLWDLKHGPSSPRPGKPRAEGEDD
jgi:hypothetical protein